MVRSVPYILAVMAGQRSHRSIDQTKLEPWARKIIQRLNVPPAVDLSKTYASIAELKKPLVEMSKKETATLKFVKVELKRLTQSMQSSHAMDQDQLHGLFLRMTRN